MSRRVPVPRANVMTDEGRLSTKAVIGNRQCTVTKRSFADGSTAYFFSDDSGERQMRVYHIAPGIRLTQHSIHTDHLRLNTPQKGSVIEIHHCREGRMEYAAGGSFVYLTPGDLVIECCEKDKREYVFPFRDYHGITISINTDIAPRCFSCFLKDVSIQPANVAERLCGKSSCFVIRSRDYIEHLFSEMYDVPCENKKAYYKIKILELFLVLSDIDPNDNKMNMCKASDSQIELAKRAASFIADNCDKTVSVKSLSQHFHVSVTHLQNSFKGVFGVTVFAYIRMQKMNAAALKLIRTDKTVMEIASEAGYDNASKFASAFRELMSEAPLEYRKSHKSKAQ